MMLRSVHLVSLSLLLIFFCSSPQPGPKTVTLISGLQVDLPHGWKYTVVTDVGNKGYPQGLDEPVFRVDFTNPVVLFNADTKRGINYNPSVKLYFYLIASKPDIMEAIKKYAYSSSYPPLYFGETAEYIVVTSPSYINSGVYSEEAIKAIRPLWFALREHIECKEDSLLEKSIQSGK
ncbi:MAG: hypothetical protein GY839_18185 [candidate division Zixibacteria bacterium]|nr:hypothetical protein [candidate division Zixibacteria bacterium]